MTEMHAINPADAGADRERTSARGLEGGAAMVDRRYGFRDLLNTIFREKWAILGVFLVTFAAGTTVALGMKPTYTAQARMLVLPSREYTLNPDVGEIVGGFGLSEERMVRSETEILKNPTLVDAVIQTLGLGRLYPDMNTRSLFAWLTPSSKTTSEPGTAGADRADPTAADTAPPALTPERQRLARAVTRFQQHLDISVVKDSSVVDLTFSHPNADIAVAALDVLIQRYLDLRSRVLLLPRSKMFMEQRDAFGKRLDDLEREIAAFKIEHNISEFADQRSLLLRQHAEINSNRMDTETRLREAEGRVTALRQQLTDLPREKPLFLDNTAQDSSNTARSILASLEARRNELLTKFTPTSRFIADIDEQIANLRTTVARTQPVKSDSQRLGLNPLYEQVNTDLFHQEGLAAALRAKRGSLEEQYLELTAQLVKFDQLEREFDTLSLNREILQKNLRTYSQKVEESLLQEEIDRQRTANVRIIERPYTGPPRSKRLAVLLFALVGAGVMAIVAAFLKDFSRQVFVSPEDTERTLGLRVLVAIPFNDRLAGAPGA